MWHFSGAFQGPWGAFLLPEDCLLTPLLSPAPGLALAHFTENKGNQAQGDSGHLRADSGSAGLNMQTLPAWPSRVSEQSLPPPPPARLTNFLSFHGQCDFAVGLGSLLRG